MSVAVKVFEPAVFGVTERVLVPATSAVLAGSVALASVEVMPTVSVEETTFQLASTALTVTLKAAARGLSATVRRSCRRRCRVRRSRRGAGSGASLKAPALIVVAGLVLAVIAPFVMSVDGERRGAGGLRGDRERLGAGDERGVGRERRVRVGRGDADGVGRADEVPVRVDRVDRDVERCSPRSERSARRSCRTRCPARRSHPASGSAASRTPRR